MIGEPPAGRAPAGDSPVRLWEGRSAFEEISPTWQALEREMDAPVFQSWAWARQWLRTLGQDCEPWILSVGGPPCTLLPLVWQKRMGLRVLSLLGEGVSDYLGPLWTGDFSSAGRALGDRLWDLRDRFDLLDLRGLWLPGGDRGSLSARFAWRLERVYEHCPVVDTSSTSWEAYLATRKKKFRANIKRAARRVEEQGKARVAVEQISPGLFQDLLAVEKDCWKWEQGTAFLRSASRRAFLSGVLQDPQIPSEIWTCRIDGTVAGFAVVFRSQRCRHYYLPSFRTRFTDVGTYLLSEIVRESIESSCAEVDLLQGDESYKLAWATQIRAVHEVAAAGRGPRGLAALAGTRLRWRLARSERIKRWRSRLQARLSRQAVA